MQPALTLFSQVALNSLADATADATTQRGAQPRSSTATPSPASPDANTHSDVEPVSDTPATQHLLVTVRQIQSGAGPKTSVTVSCMPTSLTAAAAAASCRLPCSSLRAAMLAQLAALKADGAAKVHAQGQWDHLQLPSQLHAQPMLRHLEEPA